MEADSTIQPCHRILSIQSIGHSRGPGCEVAPKSKKGKPFGFPLLLQTCCSYYEALSFFGLGPKAQSLVPTLIVVVSRLVFVVVIAFLLIVVFILVAVAVRAVFQPRPFVIAFLWPTARRQCSCCVPLKK